MKLTLVSKDPDLFKLCRETLAAFPTEQWDLVAGSAFSESDFYIWDFQPAAELASIDWEHPAKYLFLVSRNHLPLFREWCPAANVHILLKPVTRATLGAFLGQVLAPRAANQPGTSVDALRADRDAMLQCLIQANLRLQEYDQDRTNFLARAVHDFRAPLTAVSGYCGLLLGGQLGPVTEEQQEVLERMQHSAKRLSRMATAMFQLSVGGHVDTHLNLQKGDLRDCVDQALHEIMPFSEEKRLEISVEWQPSPESLYFERSQIEQVLINLLDNACKFTPKFGSIEIRGYPYFWERRLTRTPGLARAVDRRIHEMRAPNSFRIDIEDSGPGIPAEHLDRIFEEYTHYTGGQDRSGGGLGLAICKMIVSRHQGRIWAETSETGAVFTVLLPLYRHEIHTDRKMLEPACMRE